MSYSDDDEDENNAPTLSHLFESPYMVYIRCSICFIKLLNYGRI